MRYYRPVAHHVIHDQPLGFRALCAAAIPAGTQFIVLDLDRTMHMARNMGEYMGWEMCAYHHYGPAYLDRKEGTRDTSRFLTTWNEPIASSRYFLRGCRVWAYPGLSYLLWGRIASRFASTQRLRHRLFGAEPYTAIQAIPTIALMHELAGIEVATTAALADRVLDRFTGDQVFDAGDIAWLRARCPGVRIILSSASPRPTVEAAARRLGIEDWESAEIETHDDRYSSPFQLSPLYLRAGLPRRVSPPSHYRVNAGRAKVARLLERYPQLAAPGAQVVGLTDTWHGEDHCWADHFTHVIDINSTSPFPPLVVADSPVREIHSAQVLTHSERARRADGDADYVDPRRATYLPRWHGVDLTDTQLEPILAPLAGRVDELTAARRRCLDDTRAERVALAGDLERALTRIERCVADYNAAPTPARRRRLRAINRGLREHDRTARGIVRTRRAASALALTIENQLTLARAVIGARTAPGTSSARPTATAAPTPNAPPIAGDPGSTRSAAF